MVLIANDKGLWLHVNASSGVPIYLQLKDQIKRAIAGGSLRSGDQLPTVRDLAGQAVVNPNTVARVYRELELEGFIETQRGIGTFVAARAAGPGGLPDERQRLMDAAADRYLSETSQLGLQPREAAKYLADKVAAREKAAKDQEGDE